MRWLNRNHERTGQPESLLELPDSSPEDALAAEGQVGGATDGAVWVETGRVCIRNPQGLGRWPTIWADEDAPAKVRINGQAISSETVVRAEDHVTVEGLGEDVVPGYVDVSLSGDEMEAYVIVQPEVRRVVSVGDASPTLHLHLQFHQHLVPTDRVANARQVILACREAGVFAELDADAVTRALSVPGQSICVARGRRPAPGTPTRVWTVLAPEAWWEPDELATHLPQPDENGFFVEVGEPLAQVRPGQPATRGTTVTGRPLEGPTYSHRGWNLGPGVLLSADQQTAIATQAGRPEVVISRDHVHVAVYASERIDGDISAANGPLTFDGDVRIEGAVQQGSIICARGNIQVVGDVSGARLLAGGNVVVYGAAVGSRLAAGGSAVRYATALPVCQQLASCLELLGRVDMSAERIPTLCARLQKALGDGSGSGLTDDVDALHRLLPVLAATAGSLRPDQAQSVAGLLREAAQLMQRGVLRTGSCRIHHVQRSWVDASGEVKIGSAGVYMSEITTMGRVHVEGPVRGGLIRAEGGVAVEEAGSEAGVPTRFDIGTGAAFEAETVYPGTVVISGGRAYRFSVETKGIRLTEDDLTTAARRSEA